MHMRMLGEMFARMEFPRAPIISSESSVETTLSGDPDPAESCSSSADSVAEGRLSDNSAAEGHLSDDSVQARFPSDEEPLAAVFPSDDTSGSTKRMTRGEWKRWRRRVVFRPEGR